MDTESRRARMLAAYEHGPEAVVALVATLMREWTAHLETLSARVTALEGENATLRAKLETNSRNSGKPPSSDGPGVRPHPKSQRVPSGRPSGGQPGHEGHSLRLVEAPDEVQVHRPSRCAGCGQSLEDIPALRWERRQDIDLPPVRARVIEHRAATTCGPDCGTQTSGAFPAGVAAPVQYGPGVATLAVYLTQEQLLPLARTRAVLAEVFGCPVAEGPVERAIADCHAQLAATEAARASSWPRNSASIRRTSWSRKAIRIRLRTGSAPMPAAPLFEQVAALKRDGFSFAVAMVVSRRSPVSSHLK